MCGQSGDVTRLGFVRKVYAILSMQLVLTTGISCIFMFVGAAQTWIVNHTWLMWIALVLSIGLMIGLNSKKDEHP